MLGSTSSADSSFFAPRVKTHSSRASLASCRYKSAATLRWRRPLIQRSVYAMLCHRIGRRENDGYIRACAVQLIAHLSISPPGPIPKPRVLWSTRWLPHCASLTATAVIVNARSASNYCRPHGRSRSSGSMIRQHWRFVSRSLLHHCVPLRFRCRAVRHK